jgi:hypothetical protein
MVYCKYKIIQGKGRRSRDRDRAIEDNTERGRKK